MNSTSKEKKIQKDEEITNVKKTTPHKGKESEDKEKTVAELEKEIAILKEEKLLLLAEKENERKAYARWLSDGQRYANESLIKEVILPLLDNYERAVGSSQDNKDPKIENFLNGFRMLLVPTREALKREGLEEIKITPQKDLWDSKFHEVIEEKENKDYPAGTILEVLQKGYLFHQRVLSPAKVKISKEKQK